MTKTDVLPFTRAEAATIHDFLQTLGQSYDIDHDGERPRYDKIMGKLEKFLFPAPKSK